CRSTHPTRYPPYRRSKMGQFPEAGANRDGALPGNILYIRAENCTRACPIRRGRLTERSAPHTISPSTGRPALNHRRDAGRPQIFRALLPAALAVCALALGACDRKPTAAAPPPPPVTVAHPLQKNITEWDEYTGRFQAVETVEIRARVSGFIDSVHVNEGQVVKQGDLLFVIDQ